MKKDSSRLVWADALKGWLMILVVLGHVIQDILHQNCEDSHLWNDDLFVSHAGIYGCKWMADL